MSTGKTSQEVRGTLLAVAGGSMRASERSTSTIDTERPIRMLLVIGIRARYG